MRRDHERAERLDRPAELPWRCLVCGGEAQPFYYEQVPDVLDVVAGRMSPEALGDLRFAGDKLCHVAPKSGVSVCRRPKQQETGKGRR